MELEQVLVARDGDWAGAACARRGGFLFLSHLWTSLTREWPLRGRAVCGKRPAEGMGGGAGLPPHCLHLTAAFRVTERPVLFSSSHFDATQAAQGGVRGSSPPSVFPAALCVGEAESVGLAQGRVRI